MLFAGLLRIIQRRQQFNQNLGRLNNDGSIYNLIDYLMPAIFLSPVIVYSRPVLNYKITEIIMKSMLKSLTAITLCLSAAAVFAAPDYIITHNETDVASNAYVAGTIPSPYPTPAHSSRQVYWNMVRLACYGYTTADNKCSALIKMATETNEPIELGYVTMDLVTGEITPKQLSNNGYTLTVNGPGETTLTQD